VVTKDDVLANFDEPGKMELVSYMEKNFLFNMPIEKFGYLTGRSLTTFKRDFKKAFDINLKNGSQKSDWN
jgi:hypothetical protein